MDHYIMSFFERDDCQTFEQSKAEDGLLPYLPQSRARRKSGDKHLALWFYVKTT